VVRNTEFRKFCDNHIHALHRIARRVGNEESNVVAIVPAVGVWLGDDNRTGVFFLLATFEETIVLSVRK